MWVSNLLVVAYKWFLSHVHYEEQSSITKFDLLSWRTWEMHWIESESIDGLLNPSWFSQEETFRNKNQRKWIPTKLPTSHTSKSQNGLIQRYEWQQFLLIYRYYKQFPMTEIDCNCRVYEENYLVTFCCWWRVCSPRLHQMLFFAGYRVL